MDIEHPFEVVVLAAASLPVFSDLQSLAGSTLSIREIGLNGNSSTHEFGELGSHTVMIVSHHDIHQTITIVQALLEYNHEHPILVVAAEQDEATLLRLYSAGANDCIPSNIGPELLLAKVRSWGRWKNKPHRLP